MARSRCKKNAPLHGRKRIPGILKPYANLGKNGKFPLNIRVEVDEGEAAKASAKKADAKKKADAVRKGGAKKVASEKAASEKAASEKAGKAS
jgi:hypothetical protein